MPDVQMIYGPPGTGKTTKLMEILRKELASGVPKNRIALVTFTVEGARQGITRAMEEFGGSREDYPYFRTLHSLAFRELHLTMGSVMNNRRFRDFSKQMGMHFSGTVTADYYSSDDRYLSYINLLRNNRKEAERDDHNLSEETLKFVEVNYKRYKEKFELVDYTDMIERYLERCSPLDIDVALIDEAQDLTTLQWDMAKLATYQATRLYVAGDDDQAIYQWNGADVEHFLHLRSDAPPIYLNTSHRLPDSVLALAESLSDRIADRIKKPFHSRGVEGEVCYVNSVQEVEIKAGETYMFLARNNKFLLPIEEWLNEQGIFYTTKNEASASNRDFRLVKEWDDWRRAHAEDQELPGLFTPLGQQLRANATVKQPFTDAFDWPTKYLDYVSKLLEKGIPSEPKVIVSTIHGVKGGQADNVVLLLDMSRLTYKSYLKDPDREIRTFYVGVTRAYKTLTIVYATSKYAFDIGYLESKPDA